MATQQLKVQGRRGETKKRREKLVGSSLLMKVKGEGVPIIKADQGKKRWGGFVLVFI